MATEYYNKYTGSSYHIDEVFKAIGVPSTYYGSVTKRKPIATVNGYSSYTGTATQNLKLIDLASQGKLKKPSSSSSSSSSSSTTSSTTVTLGTITLQSGTSSSSDSGKKIGTVYVTWTWSKSHTDNYKVQWYYYTSNGVWFIGSDSTSDFKQSTYSIPDNATKVRVRVKPVSTTYTSNSKTVSYWTGTWSSYKTYTVTSATPDTPDVPTVEVEDNKMTATLDNIEGTATSIQFQTVKNDKTLVWTDTASITTTTASITHTLTAGNEYKVRARGYNKSTKEYGEWSDYSDNVGTEPAAPSKISTCKAASSKSIYLAWSSSTNADTYEIEYATEKSYLGASNASTSLTGIETTTYTITGMESGYTYYFRVRAVNDNGESEWTSIVSCILGKAPSAPTTWSSTSTAIVGENVIFYWVHNSQDGSSQTYGQIQITANGTTTTLTKKNSTDEDEKDKTSYYSYPTSSYTVGTEITWKVRTAGVLTDSSGNPTYGDWSVTRTVKVYAQPTLEISMIDVEGSTIDTLTQFPFYISGTASPTTQSPIGYQVTIISSESYDTTDNIGNDVRVAAGDEVYSKYFDISTDLMIEMSPSNLNLENSVTYTIKVVVTMNSGLTADASWEFDVDWEDIEYIPNAEIGFDDDTYTAYIRPYACYYIDATYAVEQVDYEVTDEYLLDDFGNYVLDADGNYISTDENFVLYKETEERVDAPDEYTTVEVTDAATTDGKAIYQTTDDEGNTYMWCYGEGDPIYYEDVTLSVYRREYNGEFVELGTGLDNTISTYVTDPHPALDYARYRIVAISTTTGGVSYYDCPGYPTGIKGCIIQWDETWSNFDIIDDYGDKLAEQPWSGSLLHLPYNLDVSDSNDPDVELVDYIGRERPVSYYGTHVNESATWNLEIDKTDKETLYGLRRLAIYMGDVYVRESSGSGYWANAKVSFSQTHKELTIPVTLTLTRVEGGA